MKAEPVYMSIICSKLQYAVYKYISAILITFLSEYDRLFGSLYRTGSSRRVLFGLQLCS
jgi:hypothetical protein